MNFWRRLRIRGTGKDRSVDGSSEQECRPWAAVRSVLVVVLLFTIGLASGHAQAVSKTTASSTATPMAQAEKAALADQVRREYLHAWNGYRKYAWGHDALKPLSHQPFDWYSHSLLMTPVDGLDTMILMGLTPQADKAKTDRNATQLQPGHVREGLRDHDPADGWAALEL